MASDLSLGQGAPLAIRRVVTGHDRSGASAVVLDTDVPRSSAFQHIPGMASRLVWASAPVPGLPFDGVDPTPAVADFVPASGATRFLIVTFPPDSVFSAPDFDPAAAAAENLALSPGLAERFEPDGMHTTETMDYGIVLDGEIWLELDEGRSAHLQRHDAVVQNGTRHAWRNKSERPATLAFVLIGASAAARDHTKFDTGNTHD